MRMIKWMSLVALTIGASGCGGLCNDGVFAGTIVLERDGWLIEGSSGLLHSTPDERFPYADGSPFLECRVIGGLSVREEGVSIDGDRYPLLEELGFIGVQLDDFGGERIVDEISGFDTVTTFGGIGGAVRQASVRSISGFNNVERVEGSLLATASITGFRSLREVGGTLNVANLEGVTGLLRVGGRFELNGGFESVDLQVLEDVGGDLVIMQTRLEAIQFPTLGHVGGLVEVFGNPLDSWGGFARGARIDGDFRARGNSPIRDADFEAWLVASETQVAGSVTICANRPINEEGTTCLDR